MSGKIYEIIKFLKPVQCLDGESVNMSLQWESYPIGNETLDMILGVSSPSLENWNKATRERDLWIINLVNDGYSAVKLTIENGSIRCFLSKSKI